MKTNAELHAYLPQHPEGITESKYRRYLKSVASGHQEWATTSNCAELANLDKKDYIELRDNFEKYQTLYDGSPARKKEVPGEQGEEALQQVPQDSSC